MTDERPDESTEEALFRELGEALLRDEFGIAHDEPPAERGRSWWERNYDWLRDQVCGSTEALDSGSAKVVTTIADLLAPQLGLPLASSAARLIAHFGLQRVCRGWVPPS